MMNIPRTILKELSNILIDSKFANDVGTGIATYRGEKNEQFKNAQDNFEEILSNIQASVEKIIDTIPNLK